MVLKTKKGKNMDRANILVTFLFDDSIIELDKIAATNEIQQEIAKIMQKYCKKKYISRFIIADDDCINEKLKN